MAPSRGKRSFYTRLEEAGPSIEMTESKGRRRGTAKPAEPRRSARIAKKAQELEIKGQKSQFSGVTKSSSRQKNTKSTPRQKKRTTTKGRGKTSSGAQLRRRVLYPSPPASSDSSVEEIEPDRYSLSIALQPSGICEPGTPLYPPLTVLLHPQQPPPVSFDLQTAQLWGMVTLLDSRGEIVAPPSPTKLSGRTVDSPHILDPQAQGSPQTVNETEAEQQLGGAERRHIADEAYLMFPNLSISEVGDYSLLVSLMEMDPVVLGGARKVTDIKSRPISVQHRQGGGGSDSGGAGAMDGAKLSTERNRKISEEDMAHMERLRKRGVEMEMDGLVYH